MKAQALALDLCSVALMGRHHRTVSAALQLQADGNEGMQVSIRAQGMKDDFFSHGLQPGYRDRILARKTGVTEAPASPFFRNLEQPFQAEISQAVGSDEPSYLLYAL